MRDAFVCLQFKINEVLLPEGEVETVSCAVFIRKAFVTSRDEHTTEEAQAEGVDADDVLYCSGKYRPADQVSTSTVARAYAFCCYVRELLLLSAHISRYNICNCRCRSYACSPMVVSF